MAARARPRGASRSTHQRKGTPLTHHASAARAALVAALLAGALSALPALAASTTTQVVTASVTGERVAWVTDGSIDLGSLRRGDSGVIVGSGTLHVATDFADRVVVRLVGPADPGIRLTITATDPAGAPRAAGSTQPLDGTSRDLVTGLDGTETRLEAASAFVVRATVDPSASLPAAGSYAVSFAIETGN